MNSNKRLKKSPELLKNLNSHPTVLFEIYGSEMLMSAKFCSFWRRFRENDLLCQQTAIF
jgi:hypothetical protein